MVLKVIYSFSNLEIFVAVDESGTVNDLFRALMERDGLINSMYYTLNLQVFSIRDREKRQQLVDIDYNTPIMQVYTQIFYLIKRNLADEP
jgi:hypothetical protein